MDYIITAAIAFVAGVLSLGVWIYVKLGDVPIIGKFIQYKIRVKTGLEEPKDHSKGFGDRRRKP